MKILVSNNQFIDKAIHNLFCNKNSYIYSVFNNINEKHKKTLALSSLVLIESYGLKRNIDLKTDISKADYIEFYKEVENENNALEINKNEIYKWREFILMTLKEKEILYKKMINNKITVRICITAALPSPPIGQIIRTDYLDGVLNISIIIGYVEYNKREDMEYPLTKSWLYRGIEFSLLRYLFPFSDMLNTFNNLTNYKYEEKFSQIYSNIIWYIQVKIFGNDFALKKGSTPTVDFILKLNEIDSIDWNQYVLDNINIREIEKNILLLVKNLFDKAENKDE